MDKIIKKNEVGVAAIGGKDSMSGTFNDISVPPTLISFAVSPVNVNDVISTEFKKAKNKIVGVKVREIDGKEYTIKAKAVIVATGGFGANAKMVEKYNPKLKGFEPSTLRDFSDAANWEIEK